jgi:mannose-6-phosphate isomerase-like protein (cupin superfamily)
VAGYTLMRATEAPDYTGDAPGAFRGYGRPMGAGQVALNVRELAPGMANTPPGQEPGTGHSHKTIDEIYFVLEGEVTIKLGDDVMTLGPRDAVHIAATTPRAMRNETDRDAAVLMVSVPAEDPGAEVEWHEGFWPA